MPMYQVTIRYHKDVFHIQAENEEAAIEKAITYTEPPYADMADIMFSSVKAVLLTDQQALLVREYKPAPFRG